MPNLEVHDSLAALVEGQGANQFQCVAFDDQVQIRGGTLKEEIPDSTADDVEGARSVRGQMGETCDEGPEVGAGPVFQRLQVVHDLGYIIG